MNKEEIMEAFGEDASVIPKGKSKTTYYIEHEKKLKPRTENTPNNIGTSDKIMEIAVGRGNRIYKTPLQFAIAVKGFETWCIEKNVAPSYAGLAYYLNISKDTLIKYTHDKTEYVCYNLVDNETGEYIYSTNDKGKLDKYINFNYLVEGEIKHINYVKSNKIPMCKVTPVKDKINKNEYSTEVCTITFASILAPIKNLLEQTIGVNSLKAEFFASTLTNNKLIKNSTRHYAVLF